MTSPHPNIVKGFYKALSNVRESHALEDFKVTVDGKIFSCHSFILDLSSDYFSGLLRSNMKEKQEMAVELENISSPTFQLILNSLYTGCELLTKENVLEVWSAVLRLQIQFLIEHCEDFVMKNVSFHTLENYKSHAEYLQSMRVKNFIFTFFLENFSALREQEVFFNLKFKYLKKIFKSDKLVVSSEDEVLDSIFQWVNYGNTLTQETDFNDALTENESCNSSLKNIESDQNMEEPNEDSSHHMFNVSFTEKEQNDLLLNQAESNERKKFLIKLLKATRYSLASGACLVRLNKDKLTQSDISVKNILIDAFTFRYCDFEQGHWPTTAIYRDCSQIEHVGIYCYTAGIAALSLKQNKLFCIQMQTHLQDARLTVCAGKLYACSKDGSIWSFLNVTNVPQTNKWAIVTTVPHAFQLFFTHQKYIYVFHSIEKKITRLDPNTRPVKLEIFIHEIENPAYALSFHGTIVVFSSVGNNEEVKTAVHSWNTEKNIWTQLNSLEFSCQNMTSFRDDRDTYILDSNGNLLRVTDTNIIGFAFISQLWSGHFNLKGALLFRKTLFIFGDILHDLRILNKLEGVYFSKHVKIRGVDLGTTNVVHYVIPKNALNLE